jgi:hypothetical protein
MLKLRVKSFVEISSFKNASFLNLSHSSNSSSELSSKELQNYSFTDMRKSSQVSLNGIKKLQVSENEGGSEGSSNINEEIKQHRRYKSLLSVIKVLKNFSMGKIIKPNNNHQAHRTIYRQLKRPREYVYVKGMSGLVYRDEISTSSSSCNRCSMRNG